jgi:hypothetical protein
LLSRISGAALAFGSVRFDDRPSAAVQGARPLRASGSFLNEFDGSARMRRTRAGVRRVNLSIGAPAVRAGACQYGAREFVSVLPSARNAGGARIALRPRTPNQLPS